MALDFDVTMHQPPSPTLTNPDMILPAKYQSTSPERRVGDANGRGPTMMGLRRFHGAVLSPGHQSPGHQSPTILIRPSSPLLPGGGEPDTTPTKSNSFGAFASSPLLRDPMSLGDHVDWNMPDPRRSSSGSSSLRSEDLENIKWPREEVAEESAEEGLDDEEEEEERFGYFPKAAGSDDDDDDDDADAAVEEDGAEDPYSTAALSRRADIILANAKKRLNLMEGNLKGARHSLPTKASSPTSSSSNGLHPSSSLPLRLRQSLPPSALGFGSISGHSRGASETSITAPTPLGPAPRPTKMPKRASSALGGFAGGLSSLDRSASLRGVRSQEVMRESRLQSWIMEDYSPLESPRSATSLDYHSFHRPITPSESTRRPASQTSEIRAQMSELKDKIFELKERAKEDHAKRASVLSFNAGDMWQAKSDGSRTGPVASRSEMALSQDGSPVLANDRWKTNPRRRGRRDEQTEYEESQYDDAEETLHVLEEELDGSGEGLIMGGSHLRNMSESSGHSSLERVLDPDNPYELVEGVVASQQEQLDEGEEIDLNSATGQTEYFEAESLVVAERHEDRADAFDYENFFLHSAMGTYSRETRRASVSSEGSVETTKALSPRLPTDEEPAETDAQEVEKPQEEMVRSLADLHLRNPSMNSISSVDTFRTATEGYDGEEEEDEEEDEEVNGYDALEAMTQHVMASAMPSEPVQHVHDQESSSEDDARSLTPETPAQRHHYAPMESINHLFPTLASALLGVDAGSIALEVEEPDKMLVEDLMQSLQNCCLHLQHSTTDNSSKESVRQRLDQARRILDGA